MGYKMSISLFQSFPSRCLHRFNKGPVKQSSVCTKSASTFESKDVIDHIENRECLKRPLVWKKCIFDGLISSRTCVKQCLSTKAAKAKNRIVIQT